MNNLLPYLKIKSLSGGENIFPLIKTQYSIGRLEEINDIALPEEDGIISRTEHCLLKKEGGQWYLIDNSTNGTIVQHDEEQIQLQELPERKYPIDTEDKIIIYKWIIEYIDPQKTNQTRLEFKNRAKTPLIINISEPCLYSIEQSQRQPIYLREQVEIMLVYMARKNLENQGNPVICTYQELSYAIWNYDKLKNNHDLANLAKEIRNIFEENGGDREWLITRRNRGYILKIDCEQ